MAEQTAGHGNAGNEYSYTWTRRTCWWYISPDFVAQF